MRLAPVFALALGAPAAAAGVPTSFTAAGVEYGTRGNLQYDSNRFSGGAGIFEDAVDWRRQEVYLFARRKGRFELTAGYDFKAETWGNACLELETAAGDFRAGHQKTHVAPHGGCMHGHAPLCCRREWMPTGTACP